MDTDDDPPTNNPTDPPADEWIDEDEDLPPLGDEPQPSSADIEAKWRRLHSIIQSGLPLEEALGCVGWTPDLEPQAPNLYTDPNHRPSAKYPHLKAVAKGNPGRPLGCKTKKMQLAENLLKAGAADVVKKTIALALEGDPLCIKLIIDRILPMRRGKPLVMDAFPEIRHPKDVVAALNFIAARSTDGSISFEEAASAAEMVEATRRALETVTLEERIKALESARTIDGTTNPDPRSHFDRPHFSNGSGDEP